MRCIRQRVAVACLTLVGAVLRFYRVRNESLWLDQLITVEPVRRNTAVELLTVVPSTRPHLPLYYVFLDLWVGVVGLTPTAMRSFSVIAGVLSIPAMYLLGKELYDERTGLLAASFVTFSRFQINHAQQVRMYSVLFLLATVSYYCFYTLGRRRWLWAYLSVSAVLVAIHPFGVLATVSQFVAAGTGTLRGRPSLRRQHLSFRLVGIVLVPVVAGLLLMAPGRTNPWLTPPTLLSVLNGLLAFFVSGGSFVRPVAVTMVPTLTFAGLAAVCRRSAGPPLPVAPTIDDEERLLVAGVIVTLAALVGVSYLVTPVFTRRYAMMTAPPLYLLISRGITRIERRHLEIGMAAVVLVGMGGGAAEYHSGDQHEQWEEATAVIETRADTDALILVYDRIATRNVEYYLDRHLRVIGVVATDSGTGLAATPNETVQELIRERDEVWLVFTQVNGPEQERLSAVVGATHERSVCSEFVRVRVCRFDRRP